ncbi:TetR/AcrR family transcriptional regulator [Solicola gregarius]|uniref:TetR/AcrR family transcriptional regulator n=1 Tax=Solicola gregarius TaxID=2908642 RepID=A0AA46YLC0_9ACTN|nr:TetR/AcrR family transcriptional regulator [Solicola gregarius]UYM06447.1 TetR/AcrR family transcriptional regulator [Solicola gregarius]
MNAARTYTMGARAKSAEETRRRIRAAAVLQLKERLRSDIRLDDIAAQAGVTVQTVLRIHGSKAELFRLAFGDVIEEMKDAFGQVSPGDIGAGVRASFDHYEEYGGVVIDSLADEHEPDVAPIVAVGRERHRDWVETVFAPQLAGVRTPDRTRLIDALVCATDVYTWKLLRRDMARPRDVAEATMRRLVEALLGED